VVFPRRQFSEAGRPFRSRGWLTASAAAFDGLHAARPFDVVHSESTSALGLLRRGVHRRVPLAAKFHGNYLGLASETVRRGLRESGASPRVREAKHFIWISAGHVVPLDVLLRFRACEAMVPVPPAIRPHGSLISPRALACPRRPERDRRGGLQAS
jgi:hypothetical protein